MELVYSTSHSSRILIGQLKQKPSEKCQKGVKELSQTNQKLCPSKWQRHDLENFNYVVPFAICFICLIVGLATNIT